MNILVIGGGRYFGIKTIRLLLDSGHNVTMATRGISNNPFAGKIPCLTLNVMDYESVSSALNHKSFDVVVNKIGYGSFEINAILDSVECGRFIHTSTAGIYYTKHLQIKEGEFKTDASHYILCKRGDMSYDDVKRQAELILAQKYTDLDWCSVRFPYVLGKNDYTKRLFFYAEHIFNSQPMNIVNLDCRFPVVSEEDAGAFMSFLCRQTKVGAINGCSHETISVREIIEYVENKTGKKALISNEGDNAPYNDTIENYSLSTQKAEDLGFKFAKVNNFLYDILDYYINQLSKQQ